MNDTIALLARLVAINSINPNLVPGGAGESDIAHFVANWLGEAGVDVTLASPACSGRLSRWWKAIASTAAGPMI